MDETMKYKVAICDDSDTDRKYISDLVSRWSKTSGHMIQINSFSSAENFLFHYADKKDIDILLLDIEMGGMNGVELAKQIRKENNTVQMIFITGFPDFIAEGYEVSALHYLMKPVREEKLFAVMEKAAKNCMKTENYLLVTVDQTLTRIPVSSILYAETFAHYVVLVTAEGEYQIRENTGVLAEKLGEDFVRPHRSYLVNLHYIHRISRTEVLLDNGKQIPLSRYNYQKINQAFIQYYKGQYDNETL